MDLNLKQVHFDCENSDCYIVKWKVKPGSKVSQGTVLMFYRTKEDREQNKTDGKLNKWKAAGVGTVIHLLKQEGDLIPNGCPVLSIKLCSHPIVMKDMCAECGADLRQEKINDNNSTASIAMVHCIPELMQAQLLGKADEERLIKERRLVLLVDLDQTLIHTTNDEIDPKLKDVFHFQLYGNMWYHTKIRPGTRNFLNEIGKLYEFHICTFGSRSYAHKVTPFIDHDGRFFSHRILSRDECFSANSKTANLSALFPCGVNLVCIIDDRVDVWNFSPNLVHVKPYHYFQHTGDINAPPGLLKVELDENGSAEGNVGYYKRSKQTGKNKKKVKFSEKVEKFEISDTSTKDTDESNGNHETVTGNNDDKIAEITANGNVNHEAQEIKNEFTSEETKLTEMQDPTAESESKQSNLVPDEKSEHVVDRTEAAVDKMEVVDDKTEAADDKMEVVDDKTEAADDKMEVVDDKTGATEDKMEVVEHKTEVVNDKTEVVEDKSEVVDDKSEATSDKIVDARTEENSKTEAVDAKTEETSKTEESENNNEKSEAKKSPISDTNLDEKDDESTSANDDQDDYLLYLTDILRNIHSEFYKRYDQLKSEGSKGLPDLREIVPATRKKILKGTYIVFSGVVPINMPLEKSKHYSVAKSLGAEIQINIQLANQGSEPATTHVVAARPGTVKVNEAKKIKGVHVVTPDWLWCCSERWERVDEKLFPLSKNYNISKHLIHRDKQRLMASSEMLFAQMKQDKLKSQAQTRAAPLVEPEVFPTYDPVSGKRINKTQQTKPNSHPSFPQRAAAPTPSSSSATNANNFATSINPLMTFSTEDIAKMGQEVDDELDDCDSDENDVDVKDDGQSSSSSSAESLSADYPRKWSPTSKDKKLDIEDLPRYPRGELPRDSDESENESRDSEDFADSIGSVDDEMVAAVEKEMLNM